jgi:putative Holliday junction resolvase
LIELFIAGIIILMMTETYNKYLAIDYGLKRVGLAGGAIFPNGLGVVDAGRGSDFVLAEIEKIAKEDDFTGIVIGLPTRSQGEAGTLDEEIKIFAHKLSQMTGLSVYFQEEYFSSSEAQNLFISHNKKVQRKSGDLDEMAAIIILERFLDRLQNGSKIKPDICL